jgi:hypothetical protein
MADVSVGGIATQVGIGALVVIVGYRIVMKFIDKWSFAEAERTKALVAAEAARNVTTSNGFDRIASAVERAFFAQTQAVAQTATMFREATNMIVQIDAKISAALDLTPVRGIQKIAMVPQENVIVAADYREDDVTPLDNPRATPSPTQKVRAQSQAERSDGSWGPYVPPKKK